MMTLEILRHSGPARLGKLHLNGETLPTPNLLSVVTDSVDIEHEMYISAFGVKTKRKPLFVDYGSLILNKKMEFSKGIFTILPDSHVGLSVPRELSEASVHETLKFAKKFPGTGAVVQGSRFLDLREKCARELGERPLFVISNGEKLLKNPRLLVNIAVSVREIIPPNSTLYFPFAPPHMFYILSYMGIDLFDSLECIIKAGEEKMLTPMILDLNRLRELPCCCSVCENRAPEDLLNNFDLLCEHNFKKAIEVTKDIREAIRGNRFRELVEEKAAGDVSSMAMLRILDMEKGDFLERYTGVS